ncbi:MAG: YhfC family glutamic-type intramembrane protease [Actinomycetota bacterium]|nr:YhfC family glutamic-type intramembrane protease [Actinomycetota bacterium]
MLRDISFIIAIIIEIGLPLAIAIVFRKKFKISWAIFFVAMALFLVSLVRIPLNAYVSNMLKYYFMGNNLLIMAILFPSFTAGLFEEGFRTLGIGLIVRGKTYEKGLMYGIGHGGGGESMIFVGFSLLANFIAYKFFSMLPGMSILKTQFESVSWFMPLVGAGERVLAMTIQIAFSVIVMHAFLNKKYYFIIFAFLGHVIVDFVASYLNIKFGILWSEISVIIFAVIGLAVTLLLRPKKDVAQP